MVLDDVEMTVIIPVPINADVTPHAAIQNNVIVYISKGNGMDWVCSTNTNCTRKTKIVMKNGKVTNKNEYCDEVSI